MGMKNKNCNYDVEVLLKKYRDDNKNIIGNKYHRLTVVDIGIDKMIEVHKKSNRWKIYLDCVCECGKSKTSLKSTIIRGKTKSCGCFRSETTSEFNKKTKNKDYRIVLDDGSEAKVCSKCNETLGIENFFIQSSGIPLSWCKKCSYKRNANKETRCSECNKLFKTTKQQLERNDKNYCSMECRNKGISKTKTGVCYFTKEVKERISLKTKERFINKENHPMYGKKHSIATRKKLSKSITLVAKRGADNPNYKHNLTDAERGDKRLIPEYQKWRSDVFARDNYSCRLCGKRSNGDIVAHHLDGYNWCKEKRTYVNNGITLCKGCHNAFHKKYGNGNNTKEQWEVFANEYKTKAL